MFSRMVGEHGPKLMLLASPNLAWLLVAQIFKKQTLREMNITCIYNLFHDRFKMNICSSSSGGFVYPRHAAFRHTASNYWFFTNNKMNS